MSSLHFSGSLWFLLLLFPGLYILWREYRGAASSGRGTALLALQAAALILLVASLTGPEWVSRRAVFHNPSVLILTDRSGSFQGGEYLGLGPAYKEARDSIAAAYEGRGFDVKEADFHERAWPVAGFGGKGVPAGDQGGAPLTSLAAAADFLDSAGPANLQAVFLFSDGRPCLDSGKAGRAWPAPVYPVALPPRGVAEVQPDRAFLPAGEAGQGNLEVTWTPVGPPRAGPRLEVRSGGKAVFSAELPAGEGEGPRTAVLPWRPAARTGEGLLRAVLKPSDAAADFDPWNDTLPVLASEGGARGGRRILVIRPLRSLDEKGMMDLLHAREDAAVEAVDAGHPALRALTAKDQVWAEAGLLAANSALLETLRQSPARVVAYARPGGLPSGLAGLTGIGIRSADFSPAAEVRPSRSAADVFPDGVVRLKAVSAGRLAVPAAEASAAGAPSWREAAVLVEGGRRGLLMAWFPLAPGKEAVFLALPPLWSLLFDPQADFAARGNLDGLLRAASELAGRQEGAVKAVLPARAHAGIPFDLEFTVPPPRDGKPDALEVRATAGRGGPVSWPLAGPGPEAWRLERKELPAGAWALELRRGGERIWGDSLTVAPKEALELARIGFDREALAELASQTGGRLIAAEGAAKVTSMLPDLQGAQVKEERASSTRLYNTRWQFLLAAALLSLSWFLRKRWDLD